MNVPRPTPNETQRQRMEALLFTQGASEIGRYSGKVIWVHANGLPLSIRLDPGETPEYAEIFAAMFSAAFQQGAATQLRHLAIALSKPIAFEINAKTPPKRQLNHHDGSETATDERDATGGECGPPRPIGGDS